MRAGAATFGEHPFYSTTARDASSPIDFRIQIKNLPFRHLVMAKLVTEAELQSRPIQ